MKELEKHDECLCPSPWTTTKKVPFRPEGRNCYAARHRLQDDVSRRGIALFCEVTGTVGG